MKDRRPVMGAEDFGRYSAGGVPIFMYFLGTIPPARMAEADAPGGKSLPSMHSEFYAPDPVPSIKTGVLTMTHAVLNLIGK